MTDLEINIAIAEACGWVKKTKYYYGGRPLHCWHQPGRCASVHLIVPNYCHDLNAMHEAEKTLKKDGNFDACYRFGLELRRIVHPENTMSDCVLVYYITTATARQRAEAFLRTIGKWKDS